MSSPNSAKVLDERFFDHRRRATSMAGMLGSVLAGGLFLYRHYVDAVWNWDLLAVLVVMAIVKVSLAVWYRVTD